MSDLLDLTGAQAAERIAAGDVSAPELFDAYRDRAGADELNAFLWVADGAPNVADGPLAGVPLAVKDLFCTEGVPSQAGSRILEGYRPPYTATAVRRLTDAGAALLGKTNMDEFAMGSSNENSGFGPVKNPWDTGEGAGRLVGRQRRRGGRGHGAVGHRHRHRRLDPPARLAVRDRGPEAHLRRGLALRDDRLRLVAGPGRPADPRRDRRRAAAAPHGGRRRVRLHLDRPARPGRAAHRRAPGRPALRRAAPADRRRHRARRVRGLRRDAEADRGAGRHARPRSTCRTPSTRSPPTT